jgi:transcriptional regulator with XRE-family HTH domain
MSLAVVPPLLEADDDRMATVGGRIQVARWLRRWDQGRLLAEMRRCAEAQPHLTSNVPSRRTLSDWETGKRTPAVDQLLLMAVTVRQPAAWFVEGLDAPRPTDDGGPGAVGEYAPSDSNREPAD